MDMVSDKTRPFNANPEAALTPLLLLLLLLLLVLLMSMFDTRPFKLLCV
jgi:hypothetical protein